MKYDSKFYFKSLFLGAFSIATLIAATSTQTDDEKLSQYADLYLQELSIYNPEQTTTLNLENAKNDVFNDHSVAGIVKSHAFEDKKRQELARIDYSKLSTDAKLTYNVISHSLNSSVKARVCKKELWGGLSTIDTWFSGLANLAKVQPVETPEQRLDALKRWKTFSHVVDAEIEKLKLGLKEGYTVPQAVLPRVISQLDGLLNMPIKDSPFFVPADRKLDEGFEREFDSIVRDIVYPGLKKFKEFLIVEYTPAARTSIGLSEQENGLECYNALIEKMTTKTISPKEIFDLGQKEVANLLSQLEVISKNHFNGMPAKKLLDFAKTANMHFKSEQEVLDYNYAALERVKRVLPQLMSLNPKSDFEIKPYPDYLAQAGAPGEYHDPSRDGSRPGIFYINTYDYENMSYADLESTLFHEGIPGHHLQFALIVENPNIHPIISDMVGSGPAEGWGLYAERLANELQLFSDPMAEVGYISNALMRASRLVVDTGLHAFGWTREEAAEYMREHTTLTDNILYGEVDRYISWPGQAPSYFLGLNEILSTRDYAEEKLGAQFSLQDFHDTVLKYSADPLDIMSNEVRSWVDSKS